MTFSNDFKQVASEHYTYCATSHQVTEEHKEDGREKMKANSLIDTLSCKM